MAVSKVRVAGSGYTYLTFKGKRIERLRNISDSGQRPVAQAEAVQGIGDDYPIEIAVPRALSAGVLSFSVYDLWESEPWQDLFDGRFASASDILDVFKQQLNLGAIEIVKIIQGPNGKGRAQVYQGVVVTRISDEENIDLPSMTQPKRIECMYTRKINRSI